MISGNFVSNFNRILNNKTNFKAYQAILAENALPEAHSLHLENKFFRYSAECRNPCFIIIKVIAYRKYGFVVRLTIRET